VGHAPAAGVLDLSRLFLCGAVCKHAALTDQTWRLDLEATMAELITRFESGGITRRELIQRLSLIVAASAAPEAGAAQTSPRSLKANGFNHLSFVVSDYARTRDFYADLLGLKVSHDDPAAKQCYLQLANGSYLLPRNPVRRGQLPPVVNHFAVGIVDWDKPRVAAELKRRGVRYSDDRDIPADSIHVRDPDGYDLQLVNEKFRP
jgi:catechol 2,3-dioxygenase-like lactoylglutathione lyase family enzyme